MRIAILIALVLFSSCSLFRAAPPVVPPPGWKRELTPSERVAAEPEMRRQRRLDELAKLPLLATTVRIENNHSEILMVMDTQSETHPGMPQRLIGTRLAAGASVSFPGVLHAHEGEQVRLLINVVSLGEVRRVPSVEIVMRQGSDLALVFDWDSALAQFRVTPHWETAASPNP